MEALPCAVAVLASWHRPRSLFRICFCLTSCFASGVSRPLLSSALAYACVHMHSSCLYLTSGNAGRSKAASDVSHACATEQPAGVRRDLCVRMRLECTSQWCAWRTHQTQLRPKTHVTGASLILRLVARGCIAPPRTDLTQSSVPPTAACPCPCRTFTSGPSARSRRHRRMGLLCRALSPASRRHPRKRREALLTGFSRLPLSHPPLVTDWMSERCVLS